MKKAIVLGGTHDHIRLIELLKERNYYTILIDYLENPPAKQIADEHIQESILDKELVLDISKRLKPNLVIALCIDQALLTKAYVSERLHLPCHISYSTACDITNKVAMKQKMLDNQIETSRHIVLEGEKQDKITQLKFPLVVKPSDANSSKGITKIYSNDELDVAIQRAYSNSLKKQVVIEEFAEGKEFSADLMIIDGKPYLLMVTENIKKDSSEHFTIFQSKYPATNKQRVLQEIKTIAGRIAQAYNISDGPLLLQMIHNDKNLRIIEFSSRIGGGSKHQFVRYITNVDFLKATLDIILRNRPLIKHKHKKVDACLIYLYAKPGIIKEFVGFDEKKKRGVIEDFFFYKTPGMHIEEKTTSSDRAAGYLVIGKSYKALQEKIKRINKFLKIVDQNDRDILFRDE